MKKIISALLSITLFVLSACPVHAEDNSRRVQIVPCSGSSVKLTKTGEHLQLYKLFNVGSFPGSSYTITYALTTTIGLSVGVSAGVEEAMVDLGLNVSISTSSSIGLTVVNTGSTHSQAALWVAFEDYDVLEHVSRGNGTCEVRNYSVDVPDYYIYGYENSY